MTDFLTEVKNATLALFNFRGIINISDDSFSWWADDTRQTLNFSLITLTNNAPAVEIKICTDFIRNCKNTTYYWETLLRDSTLAGLVRNSNNPQKIQFASKLIITKEHQSKLCTLAFWVSVLQMCETLVYQEMAPTYLLAAPDKSTPVNTSPSVTSQFVFDFVDQQLRPLEDKASKFAGINMSNQVQAIQSPPTVLANGDKNGFVSELPFMGRTSLVGLYTNDSHPRVGNGLLATIKIPGQHEDITDLALALNEKEFALSGNVFLGSWCRTTAGHLCFASYYPNTAHFNGIIPYIYNAFVEKAQWIAEFSGDNWKNGGINRAVKNKDRRLFERLMSALTTQIKTKLTKKYNPNRNN